jgi:hypothetical protein
MKLSLTCYLPIKTSCTPEQSCCQDCQWIWSRSPFSSNPQANMNIYTESLNNSQANVKIGTNVPNARHQSSNNLKIYWELWRMSEQSVCNPVERLWIILKQSSCNFLHIAHSWTLLTQSHRLVILFIKIGEQFSPIYLCSSWLLVKG